MPFKSKRQLQTCYGKRISALSNGEEWNWDCDEWADCGKPKCSGPLYRGPRGGLYFYVNKVKVYVPNREKDKRYAIRTMGQPKKEIPKKRK
ncbi:hypothetical protein GMAR_ORF163 [Golden Marseillevirus]|uniref:hypothetical protein n=1 Tax=Golden Marseillevirus TaxID=1720526 RepID=UPI000877ACB5|nr:hypothetical protein GMAR_ORF163 [Golden Marseillevirus]ALX27537.1 hypothetical protein GMAR_ORF163 [Golden Marseillevirus]